MILNVFYELHNEIYLFILYISLISQALRNLVNKSRQRIAAVYSGVDRMLKSAKKKAQRQRNQDEYSQNTEQVVEAAQEKMRMRIINEDDLSENEEIGV